MLWLIPWNKSTVPNEDHGIAKILTFAIVFIWYLSHFSADVEKEYHLQTREQSAIDLH